MKKKKPKILFLTTGGTIAMLADKEGHFAPGLVENSLLDLIPEIKEAADINIISVDNTDSSNIEPDLWEKLANIIYENYEDYSGFVITHGTDTMVYTSSALSFFLQELGKPIVITGAQVPISKLGSDGRANIINAVRVALSDLAEVCIVFGTKIIRGTRARKISTFDLEAFDSINFPKLGSIGLTIKLKDIAKKRFFERSPLFQPNLEIDVARIPVYPGIHPDIIDRLSDFHKGIVLEGYGVGNIPTGRNSLIPVIKNCTKKGVPVVICTQCIVGSTAMELYKVGRDAISAGAIPAMDMTPETTQVKLMWVLAQTKDLKKIKSIMLKDYTGEISLSSY